MSVAALYMSSESGLRNELGFGWLRTDNLAPNPTYLNTLAVMAKWQINLKSVQKTEAGTLWCIFNRHVLLFV